jgi:predicted transcriptional regulator
MRSTRTLSVTLPPEMLKRAQSIAKRQSRTMSELVREALRHYDRCWDEVNAYDGRKRKTPKLNKLVAQITPKNRYSEIGAGPERRKEKVD